MSASHPYKKMERWKAWKVVDRALDNLVENGDLKELTARRYVVGHILAQLENAEALRPENSSANASVKRSRPVPVQRG